MSESPWEDWIPGVLSKRQVGVLCTGGYFETEGEPKIDHSSIDLHLTEEAYRMVAGSIKPYGGSYGRDILSVGRFAERLQPDSTGGFTLRKKNTYVFRLRESLRHLKDRPIHGQATAKSSIGRMDVLARLIVDGMDKYEGFRPKRIAGGGGLFLEPLRGLARENISE